MYRTIDAKFWSDPAVQKLPRDAKLLLLYLITNSHGHVGGIYHVPVIMICAETGLASKQIDTLSDTLSIPKPESDGLGFIRRDKNLSVFWVVNMFAYQGRGQKNNRAVANHLPSLHKSILVKEFLSRYPAVKKYCKPAFLDTLSDTLSRVGPQKQEQDQDQELRIPPGPESDKQVNRQAQAVVDDDFPKTEKQIIEAITAMSRWSNCAPPVGRSHPIEEIHAEERVVKAMVEKLAQETPIIRRNESLGRQLFVSHAVDALIKKSKTFRDVKFACGCVEAELRDWALLGIPSTNSPRASPGRPLTGRAAAQASADKFMAEKFADLKDDDE